jgi:hypothetical protein
VQQHNAEGDRPILSLLCPGLCTAIGMMPPRVAAKQMALAYRVCVLGEKIDPRSHHALIRE